MSIKDNSLVDRVFAERDLCKIVIYLTGRIKSSAEYSAYIAHKATYNQLTIVKREPNRITLKNGKTIYVVYTAIQNVGLGNERILRLSYKPTVIATLKDNAGVAINSKCVRKSLSCYLLGLEGKRVGDYIAGAI